MARIDDINRYSNFMGGNGDSENPREILGNYPYESHLSYEALVKVMQDRVDSGPHPVDVGAANTVWQDPETPEAEAA